MHLLNYLPHDELLVACSSQTWRKWGVELPRTLMVTFVAPPFSLRAIHTNLTFIMQQIDLSSSSYKWHRDTVPLGCARRQNYPRVSDHYSVGCLHGRYGRLHFHFCHFLLRSFTLRNDDQGWVTLLGLEDHERVAVICLMEGQTETMPERERHLLLWLLQYLY